MFRFHKALWGSISAVMACLAIYCLVGGESDELPWSKRLRAAGGFSLAALVFAAGVRREMKLEEKEQTKQEPIQPPETTRGK